METVRPQPPPTLPPRNPKQSLTLPPPAPPFALRFPHIPAPSTNSQLIPSQAPRHLPAAPDAARGLEFRGGDPRHDARGLCALRLLLFLRARGDIYVRHQDASETKRRRTRDGEFAPSGVRSGYGAVFRGRVVLVGLL